MGLLLLPKLSNGFTFTCANPLGVVAVAVAVAAVSCGLGLFSLSKMSKMLSLVAVVDTDALRVVSSGKLSQKLPGCSFAGGAA